jgi:hypothetical protein
LNLCFTLLPRLKKLLCNLVFKLNNKIINLNNNNNNLFR